MQVAAQAARWMQEHCKQVCNIHAHASVVIL